MPVLETITGLHVEATIEGPFGKTKQVRDYEPSEDYAAILKDAEAVATRLGGELREFYIGPIRTTPKERGSRHAEARDADASIPACFHKDTIINPANRHRVCRDCGADLGMNV